VQSTLLVIMQQIEKVTRSFLRVTRHVIQEYGAQNPEEAVELLQERWNQFSYFIGALGDDLDFIQETVNEVYQDMKCPVPQKYSFLRMCSKLWKEEMMD
jgi:hypothetical protein